LQQSSFSENLKSLEIINSIKSCDICGFSILKNHIDSLKEILKNFKEKKEIIQTNIKVLKDSQSKLQKTLKLHKSQKEQNKKSNLELAKNKIKKIRKYYVEFLT